MDYIVMPSSEGDFIPKSLFRVKQAKILTTEDVVKNHVNFTDADKAYIPSDAVYGKIREHFSAGKQALINSLRNKCSFREKLRVGFQDFFFDRIALDKLHAYKFPFNGESKFIVKPSVGFMAGGVRQVEETTDLLKTQQDIAADLQTFSGMYPNLFSDEIIIEEYIEGEEYAVDMYYDSHGNPNIVNIYSHPFAVREEYLQMLYYTNKHLFDDYLESVIELFSNFNRDRAIRSFPIHAEFIKNRFGKFVPIEFNSCRFGGMGLADLSYYAFGFNPVEVFFADIELDWGKLWTNREDKNYCWMLCYNGADISVNNCCPDFEKLYSEIPSSFRIIKKEALDYKKSPAFGVLYMETDCFDDVGRLLNIEFNDCFK